MTTNISTPFGELDIMSKKIKKERFGGLRHMAIAKKITLFYGGIFSFSLLIISLFLMLNITNLHNAAVRKELQGTIENISGYLENGGELSETALKGLLDTKYVEVSVFDFADHKSYNSFVGEMPGFVMEPDQMPDSLGKAIVEENEPAHIREAKLKQEGYHIHMKREETPESLEFILENPQKQQFCLIYMPCLTDHGDYLIQAFKMLDGGKYLMQSLMVKLVAIDFVGIFCAFLVGLYLSRKMLRPVNAIRTAAERITIEDLSQRIPEEGPNDEMKELTVTFNSMIDRLETSFQKQNQFISDASHELRTPISVIQGYANLINRWGKSDPEILQEAIDSILTETDHMSALIRRLLFLAKSDRNKLNTQKEKVSLNEVALEIVKELEVLGVKRKIIFENKMQADIFADYDLIKQLVWIHGENALKYSSDGGTITVSVWKDQKNAYISVADDGLGIAEEDLPKIFDRFYRADKSRNKEISGTGLGLSIASWIIENHEGKIDVKSEQGMGTTFTDIFPLYRESMAKPAEPK